MACDSQQWLRWRPAPAGQKSASGPLNTDTTLVLATIRALGFSFSVWRDDLNNQYSVLLNSYETVFDLDFS